MMMTLTRSVEHHQIQIKPDILDLTRLSRDSEESKKYLLVMKLRRQIEVFSIFDNGLSTIFGG